MVAQDRTSVRAVMLQGTALLDLPKEILAKIVGLLPYAALPAFRTTCNLARELVDATSNGWVMKVEEGEALQTSNLLQRLTSLCYMWFENWTWEGDQEANFLAVILTNLSVFARLQEVRFPGTPYISLRCLRGLLASLTTVSSLALPPLEATVLCDSPQHLAVFSSIAALTSLSDLSIEGWTLTDTAASVLGSGLPKLKRLALGSAAAVTRDGFQALARLTGLRSLTATSVQGLNARVEPLTALTNLTGLRLELAPGFGDSDPGPLAGLPLLRTLGWWHAEVQPPGALRPGTLAPWLQEVSLCVELDAKALEVLAACSGLTMLQAQSITIPNMDVAGPPRPVKAEAASASGSAPTLVPVLPALRTLILGELSLAAPSEPQPMARVANLFPNMENLLVFSVLERGLQQVEKATRLKRLVLQAPQLRDEVFAFLPPLPSLKGLQLESCHQLTEVGVNAFRSTPGLEQLMLLNTPAVTDAFLADAVALLESVRTLVLQQLPNVHDEGLESLTALARSLENLEVRCMPAITPAGLQVVHRLPRAAYVAVSECAGIDKAACRQLATALAAEGRDVEVEHETTVLMPASLADEFMEQLDNAPGANQGQP